MYGIIILIHIVSAAVWTGGHLILSLTVLPKTLKEKNIPHLLKFESGYEKIGMPALIIQLITGVWLAYRLVPDLGEWFNFENQFAGLVRLKILLLLITFGLAADARLRVIPKLSEANLNSLAWHIIAVTVVSVFFVVVGVSFRVGWFL